ncbi:hypothetical protein D9M73_207490 [compost metagenome]
MRQKAGSEVIGHFRQAHAARIARIVEQVFVGRAADRQVKVHAVARPLGIRLWHE